MRGLLSIASAGLSALCGGIAWLLMLLPLPFVALGRWFDRQAVALKTRRREVPDA